MFILLIRLNYDNVLWRLKFFQQLYDSLMPLGMGAQLHFPFKSIDTI